MRVLLTLGGIGLTAQIPAQMHITTFPANVPKSWERYGAAIRSTATALVILPHDQAEGS